MNAPLPPLEKTDAKIGTIISKRFRIDSFLGRGGFATVYKATQLNLQQPVAIKVLDIASDEPQVFLERFMREARTAAQVRHPDVVNILDFGQTEGGDAYIAMELMDGTPLDVELKTKGGFEPARAQKLMVRCLDALQAAHDQNVIHRDLKPSNLFLCQAGSVVECLKILDFGIAHAAEDEQERLTATGQLLGTPKYLPPEYLTSQTVSPALDVYQMGLIFIKMLTGTDILDGMSLYQSMIVHCSGQLPVPPELLEGPIGDVMSRALHTDPTERYQNAGEFRDALSQVPSDTIPDLRSYQGPTQSLVIPDTGNIRIHTPGQTPAPNLSALPKPDPSMTSADLPVIQPPSSKLPMILGGLVALLLLAGGAFFFLSSGENTSQTPQANTQDSTPQDPTPTPKQPSAAAATPAPSKEDPPKDPAPAKPETVQIKLTLSPDNAQVFQEDTLLGQAPNATITFDSKDAKPIQLQVRAEGHKPQDISLSPASSPMTISLSPVEVAKTTKPTSAKKHTRPHPTGTKKTTPNDTANPTAAQTKPKKTPKMGVIDDPKPSKMTIID